MFYGRLCTFFIYKGVEMFNNSSQSALYKMRLRLFDTPAKMMICDQLKKISLR
jgi:hypothetical protein